LSRFEGRVLLATPKIVSQPTREIKTQLSKKPKILLLAVLITAIQSVVLWLIALWSAWSILQGNVLSLVSALFLTGIVLGAALFLSNVAIGMFRLQRWAYTPSFVMQLLMFHWSGKLRRRIWPCRSRLRVAVTSGVGFLRNVLKAGSSAF